jgi:hypothetical protein
LRLKRRRRRIIGRLFARLKRSLLLLLIELKITSRIPVSKLARIRKLD